MEGVNPEAQHDGGRDADEGTGAAAIANERRDDEAALATLPQVLKQKIAAYLTPNEALRVSMTSKSMSQDLCMSAISMKIAFKSWYGTGEFTTAKRRGPTTRRNYMSAALSRRNSSNQSSNSNDRDGAARRGRERGVDFGDIRRGPKIPHFKGRTHSIVLSGSWSLNSHSFVRRGEFYVVAHRTAKCLREWRHLPFEGGRVLWASPVENITRAPADCVRRNCGGDAWINITITFQPEDGEDYYLYIKSGPPQMMVAQSLQVSNLMAKVVIFDYPQHELSKKYGTLIRHMAKVENRGAFYTRMLQAVTRSIRIQLTQRANEVKAHDGPKHHGVARVSDEMLTGSSHSFKQVGRPPVDQWTYAVDPLLEKFFEKTKIDRGSNTLQMLEEIACFLCEHAYVSEGGDNALDVPREHNSCRARQPNYARIAASDSESSASAGPDWVPFSGSVLTDGSITSSSNSSTARKDDYFDSDMSGGAVAEKWLNAMRQQQNANHHRQAATLPNHESNSSIWNRQRRSDRHLQNVSAHQQQQQRQSSSASRRRGRRSGQRQFFQKIMSSFKKSGDIVSSKQSRRTSDATEAMMLSSQSWTVDDVSTDA